MSAQQLAEVMRVIASLTPDQNPYTVMAAYLRTTVRTAITPRWVDGLLCVFIVMYCLHVIVAAGTMMLTWRDGKAWILKKNDIWVLNARLAAIVLSTIFSAVVVYSLTWQLLIDFRNASSRNKPALEGMHWCLFWCGGWSYAHGMMSQIMTTNLNQSLSLFLGRKTVTKERRKLQIRVFNVALFVVPGIVCISICTIFAVANVSLNKVIDMVAVVVAILEEKAPSWDPATFSIYRDLLPIILPLRATQGPLSIFVKANRGGWILWTFYSVSFMCLIGPICICHLSVLRGLMGVKSFSELFRDHKASIRNRVTAATSFSATATIVDSSGSKDIKVAKKKMDVVAKQANQQVMEEYRRLAVVATAVTIFAGSTVPLAIWSSIPNPLTLVQDPVFWSAQAIWGTVVYAIGGLITHPVLLRSLYISSKASRKTNQTQVTYPSTVVKMTDQSLHTNHHLSRV